MVEFSIIVPVYQVKKYLKRLVNSVLAQDYVAYELILVDDGSSDGSEKICDEFSAKYAPVKTIHKKNGGVSSARNEGIQKAEGKYLIFLDADDYIDNDFLSDAATVLQEKAPDVLVYGYCLETNNGTEKFMPKLNGNYTQESLSKDFAVFAQESSFNSVWNKVFRADIVREKQLEFPIQKIAEDGIFVCQFLQNAKNFYFVERAYYHYCQNEGSAVHKFCASRWEDENNYLKEMQKCVEYLAPEQMGIIMGIKYRNAVMFDLYNLLESDKSIYDSSKILKEHLRQNYDLTDWNIDTQERLLRLQVKMLQRQHTLELMAMMRLKKKIKRLGK